MQTHLYISGMTCENCKKSVTDHINAFSGVNSVTVDLVHGEAYIDSSIPVPIGKLQKALGTKYTVSLKPENIKTPEIQTHTKLKSLFPLLLVFFYLILGTLVLHRIAPSFSNVIKYGPLDCVFILF